jgi:anti-anti-sigma factor
MTKLAIEEKKCDLSKEIIILRFRGSLDAFCIDDLCQKVNNLIAKKKYHVIADMSEVHFISSPALGELLGCRKRLCENGGNLVMVGLDPEVKNKLNLMGAHKIFTYYPNIRSAVLKFHWESRVRAEPIFMEVPPKLEYVPAVRGFIATITSCKDYSRRDAFRVETIVDEMCNNAIEHNDQSKKPIRVEGLIDRHKIALSFINHHKIYDKKTQQEMQGQISGTAEIPLDEKRGRGVELVRMLCDEFNVKVGKNQTKIHLTKVREE